MPENIEAIKQEVTPISNKATGMVVSNADEYSLAGVYLITVKSALKEVNEKIIAPAEEVKRAAEVNRKNLVNLFRTPLERAEGILKWKLLSFDQEARRKAAEEQARLQADADARAEREQERLLKQAEKLKTPELKEQRLAEATEVEAPVVTVATETPKVAGISTRKTWKAEVVDKDAFINYAVNGSHHLLPHILIDEKAPNHLLPYILIDEKALNKLAEATKGHLSYPGIKFYEHETMAARE